ncbi:MAG: hypothetical protein EBT86_04170 [Actinobacteria bacterium]|nr:hypothetical protein [Actinomycetota bacterium]
MSFATMIQVKKTVPGIDGKMMEVKRFERGISGFSTVEDAKKHYARNPRVETIRVIDDKGNTVYEGSPFSSGGRKTRRSKRINKRRYTKRR